MHTRVTRFDVRVEDIEKLNSYFTDTVVPAYARIPGYKGALSFADRTHGKWESTTFWETEEALRTSEQVARQLRQTAKEDFSLGEMTVENYEVSFDERVPAREQPLRPKPAPRGERARR